jgi:TonB family protein
MRPIPPMPMPPLVQNPPAIRTELPGWTPEAPPSEDDFAQVAAQARLGVQQKVVDEATRRKRLRLLAASGIAVAVAGALVFLIEKFYDPEARAREKAIAAEVSRMAEQQKVTDNLTMIEVEIERAIMNNEVDVARTALATLIERSPAHPRREFLQDAIDRAAELQKLAAAGQAQSDPPPSSPASTRPRDTEKSTPRAPARNAERVATRAPERSVQTRSSASAGPAPAAKPRAYGAPISEPLRSPTIALDAPINSQGSTGTIRRDNNFGGRTVEAGDSVNRAPSQPVSASPNPGLPAAGSSVAIPSVAPPAPTPTPPPVDVVPAKIVKRVTPVVSAEKSRATSGFVVVKFDIGDNGRVNNVEVVESSPPGEFDDAALTAVRKWQYEPRKENGVAVASQAKARLVFDMSK